MLNGIMTETYTRNLCSFLIEAITLSADGMAPIGVNIYVGHIDDPF